MTSPTYFRIEFEVSLSQGDDEPSDFITVYNGSVIASDDDDQEHKIGTVCLYIIERGRALDEGESLFDVMDCLDADSFDCFESLFDIETEELKPVVNQLSSEDRMFRDNLLLIQKLELIPEHRGKGTGKAVALRVIQKLGNSCEAIVCKPFPLQFTGQSPNDKQPKGKRAAHKKVREFWERVGFVRLPRSDYYVWPD